MGNSVSGLRRNLEVWGRSIQLSADGAPKAVAAGVTVNWDTVPAAVAAVTLEDSVRVDAGAKYIRYGSVLVRMTDGRFGLFGGTGVPTDITAVLPGEVCLVNETVLEEDRNSNHPPCIDGGRVFRDRILSSDNGATDGPTLAAIRTAVPLLTYAFN